MRKKMILCLFLWLVMGMSKSAYTKNVTISGILQKIEQTMEITNDVKAKWRLYLTNDAKQGILALTDAVEPWASTCGVSP